MTRLQGRGTALWVKVLLVLALVVLLAALGVFWYLRSLTQPAGGGPYTLEVKPGDTLSRVARTLQAHGIVKNADALRFVMRQRGTAGSLKEGLYDLNGQMNLYQVADKLAGPARIPTVNATIPEGWRLRDIPPILARAGFDAAAVQAALNDPGLSPYTRGKQKNLEGFVFPATYEFRVGETPRDVVRKMVARMNEEFTPMNVAKARALGLSVREWVTLASMVQAEAAGDGEMPVIAGVFLNRLRDGMPLGSDPTVAYGLGKNLPQLDRSAGDFARDTPYNTYTRQGLPPTPINNPGQAALLSVLNPKRKLADGRDALYFLHGLNGKIYVNHDYAAHLRDVARYR